MDGKMMGKEIRAYSNCGASEWRHLATHTVTGFSSMGLDLRA